MVVAKTLLERTTEALMIGQQNASCCPGVTLREKVNTKI
jgi:hypothetical protein